MPGSSVASTETFLPAVVFQNPLSSLTAIYETDAVMLDAARANSAIEFCDVSVMTGVTVDVQVRQGGRGQVVKTTGERERQGREEEDGG